MKIDNATKYRTADLAAFVRRAAREVFTTEEWAKVEPRLVVRFRSTRGFSGGSCSGKAAIGGSRMQVNLPAPTRRLRRTTHAVGAMSWDVAGHVQQQAVDLVDLAFTATHELGHIYGLQHAQMNYRPKWRRVGNWRDIYAWGSTLPLRLQEPKARPTRATELERKLSDEYRKLARAERRIKLATTWARKYRLRIARLRRAIDLLEPAAATQPASRKD